MKQLFFLVSFLFAVVIVSAQGNGNHYAYNPNKNIRMDIQANEYIAQGFGWTGYDGSENLVGFANFTDDVLDIRLRIPAIGVDTVYSVPPTSPDFPFEAHLGYNLISFHWEEINPMMVECSVNQPGYDFTLRYVYFRGAKRIK